MGRKNWLFCWSEFGAKQAGRDHAKPDCHLQAQLLRDGIEEDAQSAAQGLALVLEVIAPPFGQR